MRIAVFGLGYVGSVTSACLAKLGHDVVGVDPNEYKVGCLARGESPIVEKDLGDLIAEAARAGRLTATTDFVAAVKDADLVLVCVGTPSREDGSLDLSHVEHAAGEVGAALAAQPHFTTVVFRSTMLPGLGRGPPRAAARAGLGRQGGEGLRRLLQPRVPARGLGRRRLLRPADHRDRRRRRGQRRADARRSTRRSPGELAVVPIRTAEMLKYVNNAFHGAQGRASPTRSACCASARASTRTRSCTSSAPTPSSTCRPYYLKPGFAFGGSCLPKDLRAITHRAREREPRPAGARLGAALERRARAARGDRGREGEGAGPQGRRPRAVVQGRDRRPAREPHRPRRRRARRQGLVAGAARRARRRARSWSARTASTSRPRSRTSTACSTRIRATSCAPPR